MMIVYRLSGLDGDATEPVVKTLSAVTQATADPEREYSVAAALLDCGGTNVGLGLLLVLLGRGRGGGAGRMLLLQLLRTACHLRTCRASLLELGGLQALVAELHASMAALLPAAAAPPAGSGGSSGTAAAAAALEGARQELLLLLQVLEQLAKEAAAAPMHQQWHGPRTPSLTHAETEGAHQVRCRLVAYIGVMAPSGTGHGALGSVMAPSATGHWARGTIRHWAL